MFDKKELALCELLRKFFNAWVYIYFSSRKKSGLFLEAYLFHQIQVSDNCLNLNKIAGIGIYYDRFEIQNTKCLRFVSNMNTALNNDKILCGCFGIYPSSVAGILNTTKLFYFFVLCNEELNYEDYIEKYTGDK